MDVRLAKDYFNEAEEMFEADAGKLWGRSLEGPMIFVDLETRQAVANQADLQGHLQFNEGVYVGSLPGDVSPFEVADMGGNTQEWTSSLYLPRPDEIYPPGPLRVARGGSFNDTVFGSRTSYRRAYPPGYFYPFLGFRIVIGN